MGLGLRLLGISVIYYQSLVWYVRTGISWKLWIYIENRIWIDNFIPLKIKKIVNSIKNEWLKKKWQEGNFDLRNLIGMGGSCIVTVQEGKDGYKDENNVECYIHQECDFGIPFFGGKGY